MVEKMAVNLDYEIVVTTKHNSWNKGLLESDSEGMSDRQKDSWQLW